MPAFDASSIIHAWDNYPLNQFPPLWNWMASQIEIESFVIPKVAFEEVQHKAPECATWLKDNDIQRIAISNNIVQEAMRIKELLGIEGDKYHPNGVDENDILIIATSRFLKLELISDEAPQHLPPKVMAKMRIPAVCDLKDVNVPCINFVTLIKRSKVIFR